MQGGRRRCTRSSTRQRRRRLHRFSLADRSWSVVDCDMMSNFVQVETMLIMLLVVCALMITRCPAARCSTGPAQDLLRTPSMRDLRHAASEGEAHPSAWSRRALSPALQESSQYSIPHAHPLRHSISLAQAEGAVNRSVHSSPASHQYRSTTTTHPASTPAAGMEATRQLSSLSSTLPLVVGVGE